MARSSQSPPQILDSDGFAPPDLLDLLIALVQQGKPVPRWLRAALWESRDPLPVWTCDNLGVERGATAGEAMSALEERLREAS